MSNFETLLDILCKEVVDCLKSAEECYDCCTNVKNLDVEKYQLHLKNCIKIVYGSSYADFFEKYKKYLELGELFLNCYEVYGLMGIIDKIAGCELEFVDERTWIHDALREFLTKIGQVEGYIKKQNNLISEYMIEKDGEFFPPIDYDSESYAEMCKHYDDLHKKDMINVDVYLSTA